jgi:hypothetical protein
MHPDNDAVPGDSSLGNALYVTLREPLAAPAKSDTSIQPILPRNVRKWHISHSTSAEWIAVRNVQMRLKSPETLDTATSTLRPKIEWSWQALGSDQVKRSLVDGDGDHAHWDVLGRGKEGNLESWMIETEWGIEDSSGEFPGCGIDAHRELIATVIYRRDPRRLESHMGGFVLAGNNCI